MCVCLYLCVYVCVNASAPVPVGGDGGSWRGKSNPPRALHTSLFTSQMFPQTLSVGCGPRRVENQYGFSWLVSGVCECIIICRPAVCVNGASNTAAMF